MLIRPRGPAGLAGAADGGAGAGPDSHALYGRRVRTRSWSARLAVGFAVVAIVSWILFVLHYVRFHYQYDKKRVDEPLVLPVQHVPAATAPRAAVVDAVRQTAHRGPFFDDPTKSPAILVLTYNRPQYLTQTIQRLHELPRRAAFKVYVSQDGDHLETSRFLESITDWATRLQRDRRPLIDERQGGTAYLAQHYKWALDRLFIDYNHSHVVVLEDDLILSPDCLVMFEQTAVLLDQDPSIWCVSSWNDLGRPRYAHDNRTLSRTDYFPGLGWMLSRSLWLELSPRFPLDQWDHWMRLDTVSRGRSCIVPEVSRNRNIGESGTTDGAFFASRVASIKFNEDPVDDFGPVDYLLKRNYDRYVRDVVRRGRIMGDVGEIAAFVGANSRGSAGTKQYLVAPYLLEEYASVTASLDLLDTPRGYYQGVTLLSLGPSRGIVLIDRRVSPFCPDHLRQLPNPSLLALAAERNVDCDATCAGVSMVCDRYHFQFINTCSALESAFPCERGCLGGVVGDDVPNYVSSSAKPDLHGFCLTTEGWPTCTAKHWTTSRLCPCIPR